MTEDGARRGVVCVEGGEEWVVARMVLDVGC